MGNFFYRHRNLIVLPFFLLLVGLSKPAEESLFSHTLIIIGIALRAWAIGYIGEKARGREITAEFRINNTPYKVFRHPLYLGNFFLVLGTIFLYNPPLWYGLLLIMIYIFEYTMIILAEESYLKKLPQKGVFFSLKNLKSEIPTIITIFLIYVIRLFRHRPEFFVNETSYGTTTFATLTAVLKYI